MHYSRRRSVVLPPREMLSAIDWRPAGPTEACSEYDDRSMITTAGKLAVVYISCCTAASRMYTKLAAVLLPLDILNSFRNLRDLDLCTTKQPPSSLSLLESCLDQNHNLQSTLLQPSTLLSGLQQVDKTD